MKIYVAPPVGKLEKISYVVWLESNGFDVVWLDRRFKKIDGPLLLCGGADIGKNLERDANEFKWIEMALEGNHPIIGICRGMQILNKYFGGVVADLEEYILEDHRSDIFTDDVDHTHKISQFHYIQDQDLSLTTVNSRHHQYCPVVAANFKITHISFPNGYITEAIEDDVRKIWAVQWHPERMESQDNVYPLDMIK